jgi:hypothetical protein
MARHLLKCAERVKHGLCATIGVRSRAHVFSPALLRASVWVLPPRRPGAAKALLGPRRAACGVRDDGLGGLRGAGRHGGRQAIQRRPIRGHRGPLPAPVLPRGFRGRRRGGVHGQAARGRFAASVGVFPPRSSEAAEALWGTQQHDCRCTVITDAEAMRLQIRRRNGPRLPKRAWACSGTPA